MVGVSEQQAPAQTMANLLGVVASHQQKQSATYVGDGLPPVPAKLAARIVKWEFIQMHELLPEFWMEGEGSSKAGANRGKGKKRVKDVQVWLQCFAQYVSVLSSKYPEAVPELMAYTWWQLLRPALSLTRVHGWHTTQHTGDRLRPREVGGPTCLRLPLPCEGHHR